MTEPTITLHLTRSEAEILNAAVIVAGTLASEELFPDVHAAVVNSHLVGEAARESFLDEMRDPSRRDDFLAVQHRLQEAIGERS
jgi:hypothetical protein